MKICCISDLHGNLIPYPSEFWEGLETCEVLFICGDILPLEVQFNMPASRAWLEKDFKEWTNSLPVQKIYFTAGNHDAWFERNKTAATFLFQKTGKLTYLPNIEVEYISIQDYKAYKFFGTPYCHIFGNWPFMRSEEILNINFAKLPEAVDILISHDAPFGASDICLEGWSADGQHKGNIPLRNAILEKQPKYCFHGHLHSSNHDVEYLNSTKVYNTSILDESYDIQYKPLILEI